MTFVSDARSNTVSRRIADLCGLQLGVTCDRDGALTRGIDDTENRARNACIGNRTANGLERAIDDVLRRHVR